MFPPFAFVGHATFTPKALPSVIAWIDASNAASVTQSSNLISQINDLSGNGANFTQSTGANKPTYSTNVQNGLNAILFNNASFLNGANNGPSGNAISLAALVKIPASTSDTNMIIRLNGGGDLYIASSTLKAVGDMLAGNAATVLSTSGLTASTWYRLFLIWDNTQSLNNRLKIYTNNVDVTSVNSTSAGQQPVESISIGHTNGTQSFTSYIGEIVCTDAALTSTDRANLDTYWKSKWGL